MSDFGHYIRIRYGLAPQEPTAHQVEQIERGVRLKEEQLGRDLNDAELGDIVAMHCRTKGQWKYGADVNLELRRQLALLRAKSKK